MQLSDVYLVAWGALIWQMIIDKDDMNRQQALKFCVSSLFSHNMIQSMQMYYKTTNHFIFALGCIACTVWYKFGTVYDYLMDTTEIVYGVSAWTILFSHISFSAKMVSDMFPNLRYATVTKARSMFIFGCCMLLFSVFMPVKMTPLKVLAWSGIGYYASSKDTLLEDFWMVLDAGVLNAIVTYRVNDVMPDAFFFTSMVNACISAARFYFEDREAVLIAFYVCFDFAMLQGLAFMRYGKVDPLFLLHYTLLVYALGSIMATKCFGNYTKLAVHCGLVLAASAQEV